MWRGQAVRRWILNLHDLPAKVLQHRTGCYILHTHRVAIYLGIDSVHTLLKDWLKTEILVILFLRKIIWILNHITQIPFTLQGIIKLGPMQNTPGGALLVFLQLCHEELNRNWSDSSSSSSSSSCFFSSSSSAWRPKAWESTWRLPLKQLPLDALKYFLKI